MNQKKNLLPIGFKDILTNDANIQFEYGKKLLKIVSENYICEHGFLIPIGL